MVMQKYVLKGSKHEVIHLYVSTPVKKIRQNKLTGSSIKTEINRTITMLPITQNTRYISDIARLALLRLYVGYNIFAGLSVEPPEKKKDFTIAIIGE